jgi:hypothetical protein
MPLGLGLGLGLGLIEQVTPGFPQLVPLRLGEPNPRLGGSKRKDRFLQLWHKRYPIRRADRKHDCHTRRLLAACKGSVPTTKQHNNCMRIVDYVVPVTDPHSVT